MGPSFLALKAAVFLNEHIGSDIQLPADEWTTAEADEVHQEFRSLGLIIDEAAWAGEASFAVFPQERKAVRLMAKQYRQAAIQLEIMERIAKNPDDGSTEGYFPPESVVGEPVSKSEFDRAVAQLEEWKLIEGSKYNSSGLLRPTLTTDGHSVLDEEVSPQVWIKYNRQGGNMTSYSTSQTFQGNVGAVQNGDNSTANVVQNNGFDAQSFASILTEIRKTISAAELDSDTTEAADAQLDLIQVQAEAGKAPGVIKTFFKGLISTLPTALASEIAGQVGNAIEVFTQMPPVA